MGAYTYTEDTPSLSSSKPSDTYYDMCDCKVSSSTCISVQFRVSLDSEEGQHEEESNK